MGGQAMANEIKAGTRIQLFMDLRTVALVHKLMSTGIYHARLSQKEFDNAKRGQEIFEGVLLQSGFYSASELRMVLDSAGKIITVSP
jgi:hypothetical protein